MDARKTLDTRFLYRDFSSVLVPLLAAGVLCLVLAALAHAEPLAQDTAEGMAGDWILNEDLSDDPREKMQEAMQRRGGAGRPGGGGGRGGRAGDGARGPGGRPQMGSVAMSASELHIEANDQGLVLRGAGDTAQTIVIDDADALAAADDRPVGYWDGPRLVVESTGDQGPQRHEIYELVADGARLVVTLETRLPGGGDSFTVVRVFDRAPAN